MPPADTRLEASRITKHYFIEKESRRKHIFLRHYFIEQKRKRKHIFLKSSGRMHLLVMIGGSIRVDALNSQIKALYKSIFLSKFLHSFRFLFSILNSIRFKFIHTVRDTLKCDSARK